MRVKHIIIYIGMVLTALAACSHIDEDERLVYVAPAEVNRAVLIEDFTGQRCVNCPNATAEIEKLQEEYGADNVIAVAIHSGPFGHRSTISSPLLPLATALGDDYYRHWGIESQPGAMVNRSGVIYDPSQYASEVKKALEKPTPVTLNVFCEETSEGQYSVKVEGLSAENVQGRLQVWLTENNIKDMQYMPDGTRNNEYIHQHVFRASLTRDDFGDDFVISSSQPATASYSFTPESVWSIGNLQVVAFVYDASDGVLQAATRFVQ